MKRVLVVAIILCLLFSYVTIEAASVNALTNLEYHSSWIVESSSETKFGYVEKAFDDDTTTYWHSDYVEENGNIISKDEAPFEITVTFPEQKSIAGWKYYPRTDQTTGTIQAYEIYASKDGKTYDLLIEDNTEYTSVLSDNVSPYIATWDAVIAKSIKIVVLTSVGGYGTASEIVFLTDGTVVADEEKDYVYIDRTGVTVMAPSDRMSSAKYVLDGKETTYWHSDYLNEGNAVISHEEAPYELTFYLPQKQYISGISFLPRQDSKNGRINAMDVYATNSDKNEFVLIKSNHTFEDTCDEKIVDFGVNFEVKNIKVVIADSTYGYGTMAEFNFISENKDYENIRYTKYKENNVWEEEKYPLRTIYTDGIAEIGRNIFRESKVKYPIENGYENVDEISDIENNSYEGQRFISEDSKEGKFALAITPNQDGNILPVAESEYFYFTDKAAYAIRSMNLIDSSQISEDVASETKDVLLKANVVELYMKPMWNTESIEFYTKATVINELGEKIDDYVIITSDSDGDGVFELGTDFSRGKWQKIVLQLEDLHTDGNISGIYVKAPKGSKWLFDNVTSYYVEKKVSDVQLKQAASGNIVYRNGLAFAENKNLLAYDVSAQVITTDTRIDGVLSDIAIDDGGIVNNNISGEVDSLWDVPFSKGIWTLTNGATTESQIKERAFLPEVPVGENSMSVAIDSEREEKMRITFAVTNASSSSKSTITFTSGSDVQEYEVKSKSDITTDWLEGDTVITTSKTKFDTYFVIKKIEYAELDGDKNLVLPKNSYADLSYEDLTTEERVKVSVNVTFPEGKLTETGTIRLSYFERADDGEETITYAGEVDIPANVSEDTEVSAILPKIEEGAYLRVENKGAATLYIREVKTYQLLESDWDFTVENSPYYLSKRVSYAPDYSSTDLNTVSLRDMATDCEYAVEHLTAYGVTYKSSGRITTSENGKMIYTFVNLERKPVNVTINSKEYHLGYGECDIDAGIYRSSNSAVCTLPASGKVALIKISVYNTDISCENSNGVPMYPVSGLSDVYAYNANGSKLYYANYYDHNTVYAYDFVNNTYQKIYDAEAERLYVSPKETKLILLQNKKYSLIDLAAEASEAGSGTYSLCSSTSNGNEFAFNGEDEVLYTVGSKLYSYANGKSTAIENGYYNYVSLALSPNGVYLAAFDDRGYLYIFKKNSGVWNLVKKFSIGGGKTYPLGIADDGVTVYIDGYIVNVSTEKVTSAVSKAHKVTDGGIFVTEDFHLYNTLTGEDSKLFSNDMNMNSGAKQMILDIHYSEDTKYVSYILANGTVGRTIIDDTLYGVNYLFSFDGTASWYTYKNSRWNKVTDKKTPTVDEMKRYGMTKEEINLIGEDDFKKLYSDGQDILAVNAAIYMYSNATNATPIVSRITYTASNDSQIDGLYAIRGELWKKDNYRTIASVYPIENIDPAAQCYYFFALGDNWVYTVKNGNVIKMGQSMEELFDNVHDNWMDIKQFGMNYKEVAEVDEKTLTSLLLNPDYANEEFGLVYVIKTTEDSTTNNKVDIKLQADGKYFESSEVVLEITLYGSDKKIIKASEVPEGEIDSFMSWLEGRQKGYGTGFYLIKTNTEQIFINYFMISSINVYTETIVEAEEANERETDDTSDRDEPSAEDGEEVPEEQ